MALTNKQRMAVQVQQWTQTLLEHGGRLRGEYDKAMDTYYITLGQPRPAGSVEIADIVLRIDLTTGDLVGIEIPHFQRVFIKQHVDVGEAWRQAHHPLTHFAPTYRRNAQQNIHINALRRATEALSSSSLEVPA